MEDIRTINLSYHKEHLDPENKLSVDDWNSFVSVSSDRFYEYKWDEGQELLEDWLNFQLNRRDKWKEQNETKNKRYEEFFWELESSFQYIK